MNPTEFDPGPLADVEHQPDGERATLVFVRHLRHPPVKVWAALTEPDRLRRWAPFDPDRDLAGVGPAVFRMTLAEKVEEHPADVRTAVAPELLEYTWGDDLLRWELAPQGTGTRLTLRHTTGKSEWLPRNAAGWHLCLVVAERQLAGESFGPIVGAEAKKYGWEKLHDAYAARLGIEGTGWPEEIFPEE